MTEWEQLKKEYREIPVPAAGPHQMQQAIATAKQKRNRFAGLTKYGTVAAAVVLVLLIPGMLFLGSSSAEKDDIFMEADCVVENSAENGWSGKNSMNETTMTPATDGMESPKAEKNDAVFEYITTDVVFTREQWDAVGKEVLRQMNERMQMQGETYYCKSEDCPDDFFMQDGYPNYYFNEEGLLVVVFESGEVAPAEQGRIEFVIPAEVIWP